MVEKDQIKRVLKLLKRHEERMSLVFGLIVVSLMMFALGWYVQRRPKTASQIPSVTDPDLIQPPQVSLPPDILIAPSSSSEPRPVASLLPITSPSMTPVPTETLPINMHVVRPGEGLWQIAERFYGDGRKYLQIYEANKNVMSNPEDIRVGMKLRIP